jgi:prepilin-type N-terminal cleavage/methylation domain-containing protein
MKTSPTRFTRPGFTLLELVIAMGLMAVVIGMVFGIARTSLALGTQIVRTQNEEMTHQAMMDFLSGMFADLPGNAVLDLEMERAGTHYLYDLTLQNVPLAFSWGGQERVAKAIKLSTEKRRSGYLDIVLRYYENEILEDSESDFGSTAVSEEPFAEIVLLSDVAYFEWRALDGRSLEWFEDWKVKGRVPLQLELVMAMGIKGEENRHVFWLPPKQNPESIVRQLSPENQSQVTDPANPTGSGNPGTPIINIPTPQPGNR